MISTLEKEITLRFLKARKKDGFLNVISIFSFIGIGLGVAVLIIVMSVMNGFRTELINKIVGFNSHITVKPYEKEIKIGKIDRNLKNISKDLILSNSGEAIIIKSDISKGILLRGYESNDFSKLEIFDNDYFTGNKVLSSNHISIGKELSFSLDLNICDSISIMSSTGIETIIGSLPKQKTFLVSSIFESGLAEFDNNVAFIDLKTLEEFFNLDQEDRNLEIYLKNPKNIEFQKEIVTKNFPEEYRNETFMVSGCHAQVWLVPKLNEDKLSFYYDSDAFISKGMVTILCDICGDRKPTEIKNSDFNMLNSLELDTLLTPGRRNGVYSMLEKIKEYASSYT